jgi:hypothetical protein
MKNNFKEQFPILSGCEFTINGKVTNYKYLGDGKRVRLFRDREIALYCLSKQRVREILDEICPCDWDGGLGTHTCLRCQLDEKLGLKE